MKKTLAFTLILSLLLTCFAPGALANGDYESIKFTSEILGNTGSTASQWFESDETRTLFCAATVMEIFTHAEEYFDQVTEGIHNNQCFMGKKGLTLNAFFFGDDYVVFTAFIPLTKEHEICMLEVDQSIRATTMMKYFKTTDILDEYYHVNGEDIINMLGILLGQLD